MMKETELSKWIIFAFGRIDEPFFSPSDILEVIKVDQEILKRILLGKRFIEPEAYDTIFARIQKFNELIEPQLATLEDRALELATTFLLGYLKGHLPIEKIEEIGRELKKFIERDL